MSHKTQLSYVSHEKEYKKNGRSLLGKIYTRIRVINRFKLMEIHNNYNNMMTTYVDCKKIEKTDR